VIRVAVAFNSILGRFSPHAELLHALDRSVFEFLAQEKQMLFITYSKKGLRF